MTVSESGPLAHASLLLTPIQNYLEEAQRELRNLREENDKLKHENDDLKQQNVLLKNAQPNSAYLQYNFSEGNRKLEDPNQSMVEEVQKLEKRTKELQQQVEEQEKRLELQLPIVETGVAIRRRWYEQAKERLGYGAASPEIVSGGNYAAHRGQLFADRAMFKLGYMGNLDPIPNTRNINDSVKNLYETIHRELYTVPVDAKNKDLPRLGKDLELHNSCATVSSCLGIKAADFCRQDGDQDLVRFGILLKDIFRIKSDLGRNVTDEMYETIFEKGKATDRRMQELRTIRERLVRQNRSRFGRQGQGDNGSWDEAESYEDDIMWDGGSCGSPGEIFY